MASLIEKIELLIKREKTTPDKKKNEDANKSSNEILTELFGAFNATPPVIDDHITSKKSKKSKKKHKKEKKKRSRSSSSSDSDDSEHTRKRKKKKSKHKKRKHSDRDESPCKKIKIDPDLVTVKRETVKSEKVKEEPPVKTEKVEQQRVPIKYEDATNLKMVTLNSIDASAIPMPDSPKDKTDSNDLRTKLDSKGKIQIKNLKFSTVFEETVKKAEEEARKKREKFEEGEYTDSSSSSVVEEVTNSEFPKSADPGGILKKNAEDKLSEDEKTKKKHSERTSRREKESSRKRSRSKSRRRSRSRSGSRRRGRHPSPRRRRSPPRDRRRSRSRSRSRSRFWSSRHVARRSSRSPSGVKLADSEKKRLLEVARRNAINMLKNGAVPAGAAALPPLARSRVMAAIQSGGKSVDELTDFCKHLSKKEALGELSSHSSNGSDMSENEDTLAFHHPFLVKEKAPIVMNIRGGAPLPIKSSVVPVTNKEELRLQFPVSSGSHHRDTAIEWRPVSPKKDTNNMQIAKLNAKPTKPAPAPAPVPPPALPPPPEPEIQKTLTAALQAPPPSTPVLAPFMTNFVPNTPIPTVAVPAPAPAPLPPPPPPPAPPAPAPGPQAYPPGLAPHKPDISSIVSEKLLMIRQAQEKTEGGSRAFGWSARDRHLGQFTGSTGAQILTPKELASGTQAWAKKDQLQRAAPVAGGMGMHLLQKMGWTPGRGLGKEGTGTLQPLLLEVKLDTRGLQSKEEGPRKGMKGRGGGGGGGGMPGAGRGRAAAAGPAPLAPGGKHPVSLLGEYCSKHKLGPPEYDLCFECGPDHKKNFLFKVKVAGVEYQPAVASINKKQAKADAAQLALQKLGILP